MTNRRVVYVTYDGLEDQLGQSQILPYIRGLAERGHRFEILSFEKPGVKLRYRAEIAPNIHWTALRYHKTPILPATALDMTTGLAAATLGSLVVGADLIHVRSYVPCTLALPLVTALRIPLLFDMRGLWIDERVENGGWTEESRAYRTAKRLERLLLTRADTLTMLTMNMQRYLRHEYRFASEIRGSMHVIPTCTDLEHFSPNAEPDPEVTNALRGNRVLIYLGAIGKYYQPREMGEFYLAWRKYASPARLLVVSRQDPTMIRAVLAEAGVAHELVHRSATRDRVPAFLRTAEASFGFRSGQALAAKGCAPTKLGEALGCGLPFASSSIGDVEAILKNTPAGVCLPDVTPRTLDAAARELAQKALAPDVALHARALAERWFGLAEGLTAYDAIYRGMPLKHGERGSLHDTGWPS